MRTSTRRGVQPIGEILTEIVARKGLARLRGQEAVERAWRQAVGEPGAKYTRVGSLRRGVLEVLVANSVLLQELAGFHKESLLHKLRTLLESQQIHDLRFHLDENV